MEFRPQKIKITIGGIPVVAELKPNRTAQAIIDALPIEAPVNQWGEEFYCNVPGVKDHRETAKNQVKVGDVAFWGMGQMLAVFFGRTPMSLGEDPVPADRVNVIGKVEGDVKVLRQAAGAITMRVEILQEGA
ncbi:MAG: cyclophilin-like fold protein [Nitrospirota bacterium]|nr:cyclophilin-like fold protein [Nitrospirota bacterium]